MIQMITPRKRHRSAMHKDMESALYLCFINARAQNIIIMDDILREKAKSFGNELGITEFRFSNGWLTRFKLRHSISCLSITGESAGIDKNLIRRSEGRS